MGNEMADAERKIRIFCPECNARFKVKPEVIGKERRCPNCKKLFRITEDVIVKQPPVEKPPKPKPPAELSALPEPEPEKVEWQDLIGEDEVFVKDVGFSKGDQVMVDFAGSGVWVAGRISERVGDKFLVTAYNGVQGLVPLSNIVTFGVIPGCNVLYFDELRGAYMAGEAHDIKRNAVYCGAGEELNWRFNEVVFPFTADTGMRVVRKEGGSLTEQGRISQVSRNGIRILFNDGFESGWHGDERGAVLGIHPAEISPNAPFSPPKPWTRPEYLVPGVALLFFMVVFLFLPLMFSGINWCGIFFVGLLFVGVYTGVAAIAKRFTPPMFWEKLHDYVIGSAAVIVVLASLFFRTGCFYKITGVLFYGGLIVLCWAASGSLGKKYKPKPRAGAGSGSQLDRESYVKGERVFCVPDGEQFRHIARFHSREMGRVKVWLFDGTIALVDPELVFPYDSVEVRQPVLAFNEKKGSYQQAVIVHIEDDTFTIRFNDFSTAVISPDKIWLPVRLEAMKIGQKSDEELGRIFTGIDNAITDAQTACEQGDTTAAHRILDDALKMYSWAPELHYGKALTYRQDGNYRNAVKEAEKAVGDMSSEHAIYTVLGNLYLQLKENIKALEAFRWALNLEPDEAGHWQNLGIAHERLGNSKEAEKCFDQAKARGAPSD